METHRRILILDTPDHDLEALSDAFGHAGNGGCSIERVVDGDRFLQKLHSGLMWDLVVIDYVLGDGNRNGKDLLEKIGKMRPELTVVVTAEQGDVDLAAEAVRAGANDFLVRTGKLADRVKTLLAKVRPHLNLLHRNKILREQNMLLQEASRRQYEILGESPEILKVLDQVERVAAIPRPVLIVGERGTGKELVARAIHRLGGEPSRPMVVVNCAAFPDNLLESELFGYEKGAFTGADNRMHGKFELAGGGTLFLDEIGHMTLSFQQKILRVVEYGTFNRVGGSGEIQVNTRIIAATNANLNQRMEEGQFLRDLYDRLTFEVIHVPPLRQRQGDIELLARHFLNRFMQEIPSLRGKRLSSTAIKEMNRYSFPGNVRELKNIIERAAYRDTTNEITPEDIGLLPDTGAYVSGKTFNEKVERFKEQLILEALEAAGHNQAEAARRLKLSYHQYRYFLRKYTSVTGEI